MIEPWRKRVGKTSLSVDLVPSLETIVHFYRSLTPSLEGMGATSILPGLQHHNSQATKFTLQPFPLSLFFPDPRRILCKNLQSPHRTYSHKPNHRMHKRPETVVHQPHRPGVLLLQFCCFLGFPLLSTSRYLAIKLFVEFFSFAL